MATPSTTKSPGVYVEGSRRRLAQPHLETGGGQRDSQIGGELRVSAVAVVDEEARGLDVAKRSGGTRPPAPGRADDDRSAQRARRRGRSGRQRADVEPQRERPRRGRRVCASARGRRLTLRARSPQAGNEAPGRPVGAIRLAERARQLGFLDVDAPQDCRQRQRHTVASASQFPRPRRSRPRSGRQAGVGRMAHPPVRAARHDGLIGVDLDRGTERPTECRPPPTRGSPAPAT